LEFHTISKNNGRELKNIFLLFLTSLIIFASASAQTLEELQEQITSMEACRQSLKNPDCNLDILDPDIREILIQIHALEGIAPSSPYTYEGNKSRYFIEVSHNDELFIINGERYEARTYCFNMIEGDPVIFLEGSALGVCVTAELLNLRTRNECPVWCE